MQLQDPANIPLLHQISVQHLIHLCPHFSEWFHAYCCVNSVLCEQEMFFPQFFVFLPEKRI